MTIRQVIFNKDITKEAYLESQFVLGVKWSLNQMKEHEIRKEIVHHRASQALWDIK